MRVLRQGLPMSGRPEQMLAATPCEARWRKAGKLSCRKTRVCHLSMGGCPKWSFVRSTNLTKD